MRRNGVPGSREVPASHQLNKCKAANCTVTPRGCNLRKHYVTKTNWDLLNELRTNLSEGKEDRLIKEADPHTIFLFTKGYSRDKLPSYTTHARVPKPSDKDEGVSGQQALLANFLQVSFLF